MVHRGSALIGVDQRQRLERASEGSERGPGARLALGRGLRLDRRRHPPHRRRRPRRRSCELLPTRSRSRSGSATRRSRASRSAGSRSCRRSQATSRGRSTSTGSRWRRSRRSATGLKRRGSSPRWRGCISQHGDADARTRRRFFDSVQAYSDVASVRGVGLSLIGLAATEAVEGRPETAVRIAAAAEVYAAAGGHRQRLLRRDPGARVRRAGAGGALGRRGRARDGGRPPAHDRGGARPGPGVGS